MTPNRAVTSVRLYPRTVAGPVTLALTGPERSALEEARMLAQSPSLGAWIRKVTTLAATDYQGPQQAADAAGVPLAAWVRLVCMVASGQTTLLAQLWAVAPETATADE